MPNISSAIATFSAKFINELDNNKNTVASPLSCEVLLALLTLGAADPSHRELLAALEFPDDDTIRSSFTKISSDIRAVQGVTLNMANKIYFKDGDNKLSCDVLKDVLNVFDAAIEKMNFSDSATAAGAINTWVEAKTGNHITGLFNSGDFDASTRLVLVNALYFKGKWKHQFKREETKNLPFNVNKKKIINIAMMHQREDFRYGISKRLYAKLLEMPYVGEKVMMLVVLPDDIEGLNDVLGKLAAGYDLMHDLDKMWSDKVDVTLPKFKIETEINLNALLPKLGITSIFDAHNSGLHQFLAKREMLSVSKAIQKAIIKVNEEGAEAAAATGAALSNRAGKIPLPPFVADRPFLYALYGAERITLFIGTFNGRE